MDINHKIARACCIIIRKFVNVSDFDIFLNPNAGYGEFLINLPKKKRYGIDNNPKHREVSNMNFLNFEPIDGMKYITIGRTPLEFEKFFTKACEISEMIAFVIPKTFKYGRCDFTRIYYRDLSEFKSYQQNDNIELSFQIWKRTNKYRVLSLFSGCGGMDMGFGEQVIVHKDSIAKKSWIQDELPNNFVKLKKLDFSIVFQNDILPGAKKICVMNNTDHNYHIGSIYTLLDSDFDFPDCDVIVGGFPCQDFSHAGKRKGFKSNKSHDLKSKVSETTYNRGNLYKCFVKVIQIKNPKIFVAENVYGLLTMPGDPIKQIIKDFADLGYTVTYQLVNCIDLGIPQTRKRVIIIGIRNDHKNELPDKWHILTKSEKTCYVGQYLQHLKEPSDSDDFSQKSYSKAKRLKKGQGQTEINLNGFAPTMRAEHHGNIEFRRHNPSILNPSESNLPERRLTVREAALIQTFPPTMIFNTTVSQSPYKYIGNAVPPLLGYIIAKKVLKLLRQHF